VRAFRDALAAFIQPVPDVIVAAVHAIGMAADAGTRVVQSAIGDTALRSGPSQIVIRVIGRISLQSRIAYDLRKRVDAALNSGSRPAFRPAVTDTSCPPISA
jgi:hypothetical protein